MNATDVPYPAGGIPEGGQPSGSSRGRSWVKLTILLILLAALGWVLMLIIQYCRTGSIENLPGLTGLGATDRLRYSESFSGESGLDSPLGVAVGNSGGHLYVSESGGERRLVVFNREGEEIGSFVPPGAAAAARVPMYVAVGPDERVYVSDRTGRAIHIFGPDGESLGAFQPKSVAADDWHPMGLAFDSAGNLYVTDVTPGKHRVMVFDSSGSLKLQFGKEGEDQGDFWFPNGVAVDGEGRIYVADGNNGRVQIFDDRGQFVSEIPRGYAQGNLSMPRGVAIDDQNRLFVVDTSLHSVKVYDISGDAPEFQYALGGYGPLEGQFRFPNGIAVDDSGRVYITDKENGRVQLWTYPR